MIPSSGAERMLPRDISHPIAQNSETQNCHNCCLYSEFRCPPTLRAFPKTCKGSRIEKKRLNKFQISHWLSNFCTRIEVATPSAAERVLRKDMYRIAQHSNGHQTHNAHFWRWWNTLNPASLHSRNAPRTPTQSNPTHPHKQPDQHNPNTAASKSNESIVQSYYIREATVGDIKRSRGTRCLEKPLHSS